MYSTHPHRWGAALAWQWGLWALRIVQIPLQESKGEESTKSPPVWPSEPSYGGAKISGDPVQSVCSQGVLAVPLLASILRS